MRRYTDVITGATTVQCKLMTVSNVGHADSLVSHTVTESPLALNDYLLASYKYMQGSRYGMAVSVCQYSQNRKNNWPEIDVTSR